MPLSVNFCNASVRDKEICRSFGFYLSELLQSNMSLIAFLPSRKHLRTKVTPNLHLAHSKNGGSLVIK